MSLVMTSSPLIEPVSLSEAKAFLRIDSNAEDLLVSTLILTSRLHIEAALGLALMTQAWTLTIDKWPSRDTVLLPLRPVSQIALLRLLNVGGQSTTLDPASYRLDATIGAAKIVSVSGAWPAPLMKKGGIEITFWAGFGDETSDIPEPIRHALRLLIAHWYENREPLRVGAPEAAIPAEVSALLTPYRAVRL